MPHVPPLLGPTWSADASRVKQANQPVICEAHPFVPTPCLQGDSGTDAFRCVEMREGAPWLWQADAYGVAACAHTLLHGRYLEVERVRDSATGGW